MLDWNKEHIESISNSVIKMAIATNRHPFKVLNTMMRLADQFELNDVEGMAKACRKHIRTQQPELRFTFDEPECCEQCYAMYHDSLLCCPNCGATNVKT